MKKLILILMVSSLFAQTYEDVVILKNGSEVHGIIIEQKPNEYIKIKSGKNIFVYQMNEVKLIRKELNKDKDDIRNIYLSLGAGFVTNKNIDFGQLSFDVGVTKNVSIFLSGGFPTVIGGGLAIQQNRSGNGIYFTAGTGFNIVNEGLDIVGSLGYQFRLPNSKAFAIIGIMSGVAGIDGYYGEEFYIWPVISLEVRI